MNAPQTLWLTHAVETAQAAGETIMAHYRAEVAVHIKGGDARNLVTDADLAADAQIGAALRAAFPDHAILSEETYQPGDRWDAAVPTWAVDPIDGTSNFAHRLPLFAVSIGLLWQGRVEVGVIHAPALGWTFAAAGGQGATLNGVPLAASHRGQLAPAIVACDWPRDPARRRAAMTAYAALGEQVHTLRSFGSAALGFAAVAAGWIDGYFNLSLYPWDTVAGALLAHEAGGLTTALDGSPWRADTRAILVSNGRLHAALLDTLAPHLPADG